MKSAIISFKAESISFTDLPPTLDGILAGIAFQETRDVAAANVIPEIKRTKDGVCMASRAMLIGYTHTTEETKYRAPTAIYQRDPELIEAVRNPPRLKSFIKSEIGATDTSNNTIFWVDRIAFACVGDVSSIAKKLDGQQVGTNRKDRMPLTDPEIIEIDETDLTGIVDRNGVLLRPVPQRLGINGSLGVTKEGYWQTPYTPRFARVAGIKPEAVSDMIVPYFIPHRSMLDGGMF